MFDLVAMLSVDEFEVFLSFQDDLVSVETFIESMEVQQMLSGPEDKSDAILVISAGSGGSEAEDWTMMLQRMYLRWAGKKGFECEILDLQSTDVGIKSVMIAVRGEYAYGLLRAENGVHRLIRNSPFDSNDRRHTSFSAVEVVPELDDAVGDIVIKPEDLKVDTYRSGGKGGQHVNKVESAIRLTHLPTGIIVACQQERSQHKNRATAMKIMRGKLYEVERQKREAAFEANYGVSKMHNGFGSQVRSYTMSPTQLVKDERTELKESNIQSVLDGNLDNFINAYLLMSAEDRKKELKSKSKA